MQCGKLLILAFFLLNCLSAHLSVDEDLQPIHTIVKRNRFKMKDKSVVYNDSMEVGASKSNPKDVKEFNLTTMKPEKDKNKGTIDNGIEDEVSDAEREIQRLAQKMKEGVEHINMDEYINEEDAELGTNEDFLGIKNLTASNSTTPPTKQNKGDEASGDVPQKLNMDTNQKTDQNFEKTNQLPPSINTIPTSPQPIPHSELPKPQYLKGDKGDRGDRGEPGVCEQRCVQQVKEPARSGPMGLQGLPGLKGEKGECIEKPSRPSYETNNLPTDDGYENNRANRYNPLPGQKGDKGDRGELGPQGLRGLPGQPAPQTQPTRQQDSNVVGGVKVYETAVELFSSAPQAHIGSLAFALSSQQLFIRVNNGWQGVKLEGFYPTVERHPTASSNTETNQPRPSNQIDNRVNKPPISQTAEDQHNHHAGHQHIQAPKQYNPEWYNRHQYEVQETNRQPQQMEHSKKLHMIALNEPLNGDMEGVRGADLECYRQAREAGFKTTFRAFLSSRVQDLNKMVYPDDRTTPVYNLKGDKLFDTWNSVFEGGIHAAVPILSFNGKNIFDDNKWNDRWIWHGSTNLGNRKIDGFCDIWRSSSGSQNGIASPLAFNKPLTFAPREVPCYRRLAVLCVENMSQYNVQRRVGKRIPNYYFDNYL